MASQGAGVGGWAWAGRGRGLDGRGQPGHPRWVRNLGTLATVILGAGALGVSTLAFPASAGEELVG